MYKIRERQQLVKYKDSTDSVVNVKGTQQSYVKALDKLHAEAHYKLPWLCPRRKDGGSLLLVEITFDSAYAQAIVPILLSCTDAGDPAATS